MNTATSHTRQQSLISIISRFLIEKTGGSRIGKKPGEHEGKNRILRTQCQIWNVKISQIYLIGYGKVCPGEVFGDTGECCNGCLDGVDEEVDGEEGVGSYKYTQIQFSSNKHLFPTVLSSIRIFKPPLTKVPGLHGRNNQTSINLSCCGGMGEVLGYVPS